MRLRYTVAATACRNCYCCTETSAELLPRRQIKNNKPNSPVKKQEKKARKKKHEPCLIFFSRLFFFFLLSLNNNSYLFSVLSPSLEVVPQDSYPPAPHPLPPLPSHSTHRPLLKPPSCRLSPNPIHSAPCFSSAPDRPGAGGEDGRQNQSVKQRGRRRRRRGGCGGVGVG